MPALYLNPPFGLGNRLTMLASAIRLCQIINYELVLIWDKQVTPFHDTILFDCEFSEIFTHAFRAQSNRPQNTPIIIPASEMPGRTFYDVRKFSGHDIFIDRWTHFIFSLDDTTLESDILTNQLREALWSILAPSALFSEFLKNSGLPLPKRSEVSLDLGVHIRKGGHVSPTDARAIQIINRPDKEIASAVYNIKTFDPSIQSIFMCGQSRSCLLNIAQLLATAGITPLLRPENHPMKDALPAGLFNTFDTITDFLTLTRCKNLYSSESSTFGAVAAFANGATRYIHMLNGEIQIAPSNALSGLGL